MNPKCPRCREEVTVVRRTFLMVDKTVSSPLRSNKKARPVV